MLEVGTKAAEFTLPDKDGKTECEEQCYGTRITGHLSDPA